MTILSFKNKIWSSSRRWYAASYLRPLLSHVLNHLWLLIIATPWPKFWGAQEAMWQISSSTEGDPLPNKLESQMTFKKNFHTNCAHSVLLHDWLFQLFNYRSSKMNFLLLFCPYVLLFFNPKDYIPPGSSVKWDFPDKNPGMSCHFLL